MQLRFEQDLLFNFKKNPRNRSLNFSRYLLSFAPLILSLQYVFIYKYSLFKQVLCIIGLRE